MKIDGKISHNIFTETMESLHIQIHLTSRSVRWDLVMDTPLKNLVYQNLQGMNVQNNRLEEGNLFTS